MMAPANTVGCGALLPVGQFLVTKCGCRPATLGGRLALCPSCFKKAGGK